MKVVKVLVCGGREWDDRGLIEDALMSIAEVGEREGKGVVFMHGGCRGADMLAHRVCQDRGYDVEVHEVSREEWRRLGPAAGPIRNRKMLDRDPKFVLAFHADIENSRGTKDCVNEAVRRGIDVLLFVGPDYPYGGPVTEPIGNSGQKELALEGDA